MRLDFLIISKIRNRLAGEGKQNEGGMQSLAKNCSVYSSIWFLNRILFLYILLSVK